MSAICVHHHDDLAGYQEEAAGDDEIDLEYVGCDTQLLTRILEGDTAHRFISLVIQGNITDARIGELARTRCPRLLTLYGRPTLLSQVLEHRARELQEAGVTWTDRDDPRVFELLAASGVEKFTLYHSTPLPPLFHDFLRLDKLTHLNVGGGCDQPVGTVLESLINCARLTTLAIGGSKLDYSLRRCTALLDVSLHWCTIGSAFRFPEALTSLAMWDCTPEDSAFLVDSSVVDLIISGEDGGRALCDCAANRPMGSVILYDSLSFLTVGAIAGIRDLNVITTLDQDDLFKLASALRTPGNILSALEVELAPGLALNGLRAALASPECRLERLCTSGSDLGSNYMIKLKLLPLLFSKNRPPIRRLPLEMFRLVGGMLL